MTTSIANWTLDSYTNSTWTDLVNEGPATITALLFSNTTGGAITVDVRLTDDLDNELAQALAGYSVAANSTYQLEISSLNVTRLQKLQVQADAAGLHFIASGVVLS